MHRATRTVSGTIAGCLLALLLAVSGPGTRVADAGGGGCHQLSEEAAVHVELLHTCYMPTVTHIEPGTTITWVNRENVPHTVTSAAYDWGSAEQLLHGDEFTHRFDEPGTYPYWCTVHPGMMGAVVVDGDSVATPLAVEASAGGVGVPPAALALVAFVVGATTGLAASRSRRIRALR